MQLLIFFLKMAPLVHIHTYINNTVAQGWSNRGSVRTASSVGPILRELYSEARPQHIHASVGRILGEDNKMEDAVSWITHLPDWQFLSNSRKHFPQSKTWRLLPLPYRVQDAAKYYDAQQAITQGFSDTIFNKNATAWCQWQHLCSCLKISPNLKDIEVPIPFLQIFSERVRIGFHSTQGQPIKKQSVD